MQEKTPDSLRVGFFLIHFYTLPNAVLGVDFAIEVRLCTE
jgi:hypothetical protein